MEKRPIAGFAVWLAVRTPCTELCSVFTPRAVASTVIVWVSDPTCNLMLRALLLPMATTIWDSIDVNPFASTRTWYFPATIEPEL